MGLDDILRSEETLMVVRLLQSVDRTKLNGEEGDVDGGFNVDERLVRSRSEDNDDGHNNIDVLLW